MTIESDTNEQRLQHCYERLTRQGALRITADELEACGADHERLVVMLLDDPLKYPEVADNCVIIPEAVRGFPPGCFTLAFADRENSRALAERFKVLKQPAVLFFHRRRSLGVLSGLKSWAEVMQWFHDKLRVSPALSVGAAPTSKEAKV